MTPPKKTKVLVVGQTPPPWGGQAVMIAQFLEGPHTALDLYLARMRFSDEMDEIGAFRLKKIARLFSLVGRAIWLRFRQGIPILYYPPASPQRLPLYRDFFVLGLLRPLFKKVVFHFHAGGISEMYPRLNRLEKYFFRRAYFHPDVAIRPSELNPPDGQYLGARHDVVIPHGIPDHYPEQAARVPVRQTGRDPQFLYAGLLGESKGVGVLLRACERLMRRNVRFHLTLIGRFAAGGFECVFKDELVSRGLQEHVTWAGEKAGDERWPFFAAADALVFPTFFEAESFGLVALEAMQFELPVIATRWRGLPSVVRDGETGFLVPVRDDESLAQRMETLATQPELRQTMGRRGREIYRRDFTVERWQARMEEAMGLSIA